MRTANFILSLARILAISTISLASTIPARAISNAPISQQGAVELRVTGGRAITRVATTPTADPSADGAQPPVIAGGEGDQSADVPEGNDIIIRVTANGTAPLFYQWQYNHSDIPGATNSDLLLPAIQVNQSGGYSVVVSNSAGSAESAVTYVNVVPKGSGGTIPQNPQPGTFQFTRAEFDAIEGLGSVSIDVERTGDTSLPATVSWTVHEGTATPGADYEVDAEGKLSFAPGETEQNILVEILDDTEVESTESISFSLHDPTNAVLGQLTTTTLNILDDDDDSIVRPPLNASSVGGNLVLTWPAGSFAFYPEKTTELTPPVIWTRCEFPVQAVGSQNQVVIPGSDEQFVFFRLAPAPAPADVDIDVDTNRSGEIEDDEDEVDEDKPVKFLEDKGALVLVNCNADRQDRKPGDGLRDMDDKVISGPEDEADMSPVSLELKRDLGKNEILYLSMVAFDDKGVKDSKAPLPIRFMDKKTGKAVFGTGKSSRMDDFPITKDEKLFPGGKKIRYDGRFLLEGLRFATEMEIKLAIYNTNTKAFVAEDIVRVATTPWLANHHEQPLIDPKALAIAGNVANSQSYPFANAYGAGIFKAGEELEFVQDGVEWGYQVRRQKPAEKSRVMITALRLYTEREDKHPLLFAGPKVGVYGWSTNDEKYFENSADRKAGDQGGNVECLPPTDKFPFGRIIYGDFMSPKLRAFLTRQGVQFGLELKLAQMGFPHVDEMIVVVPKKDNWVVILPDWDAGRSILAANKDLENVALRIVMPGQVVDDVLTTYGKILDYIDKQADGKKWADRFRTGIAAVDKLLKAEGVQTLRLPGMYFVTAQGGQNLRGWPRNIANCQVINPRAGDPGTLVVSLPPQLENKKEDPFLTQWKAIFQKEQITIGLEDMTFAWQKGGEVHCSSNGIREPMKK